MAFNPKGDTLFFKSRCAGLKTLPCQTSNRISHVAILPNGLLRMTMAVPFVSPTGISPSGLLRYNLSSSAWDRLNKSSLAMVKLFVVVAIFHLECFVTPLSGKKHLNSGVKVNLFFRPGERQRVGCEQHAFSLEIMLF